MTQPALGGYSNLSERPPGRWLGVASRLLPGVALVQAQVGPFAQAWRQANLQALSSTQGPLWVVLGDSLSQGIGASSPQRGWVGQLNAELGGGGEARYRIVNLAVSGARTGDVLARQLPVLERLGQVPDLVTLLIGSNDLFSGRHRAGLADRLTELLDRLPAGSVVATLPNPSRTAREINAVIERAALERGVVIAEMRGPRTTTWRGKLAADHFHPNDRGYRDIAAIFAEAIRDREKSVGA